MKKLPECQFCGAWLVPPRETMCPRCEAQWNAGARRADTEWALQPHERSDWNGDQDTTGAPLHGSGSREARHAQHMVKAKEKE